MNDAFVKIYANDRWGHGSGEGSMRLHTRGYVALLQHFMIERQIESVVDMGCGDWQFSQFIDWSRVRYQGFDVVPTVVEGSAARFARDNVTFRLYSGDPTELPPADLLIAKDVLQHLPDAVVFSVLSCLSKYRYALFTNCVNPQGVTNNKDIKSGSFRQLDLRRPPFNLRADEIYTFSKHENLGKRFLRRLLRRPVWKKHGPISKRKRQIVIAS